MNFGRVVKLYVNGFTIEKLRINFSIEYRKAATPAEGHVEVYNLTRQSRTRIATAGGRFRIQAGHAGRTLYTIGDGDVRRVSHSVMPPDVVTRIYFGGNVEDRQNAVWVQAFPGSVHTRSIVEDAVSTYDRLVLGDISAIPADSRQTDFSASGQTDSELKDFLEPIGFYFYEDKGVVNVAALGEVASAASGTISESSGMIGSPEHTEDGVRVRTLLSGRYSLADTLRVHSTANPLGNTLYTVESIKHVGDNWGGGFETQYELIDPALQEQETDDSQQAD